MGKSPCTGGDGLLGEEEGVDAHLPKEQANMYLERGLWRADSRVAGDSLYVIMVGIVKNPYLTDGETKACSSNVICPRSHSQ